MKSSTETRETTKKTSSQAAKPESNAADRRQKVQSAEVGLLVLRTLSELGGSASITALAARLQEPVSKVHRYLASLVNSGFVFQDGESLRYVLGSESISLGIAAMRQSDPISLSAAELPGICERLGAVCFVACMGSHGPVVVRWHEPEQPVVVNVRVGSVLPILWSATGRAFGAFASCMLTTQMIARELRESVTDRHALLPDKRAVEGLFDSFRACGYASVNDTLLQGVSSVAVPVYSADGVVRAVITALGMSSTFRTSPTDPPAKVLLERSEVVSRRLGARSVRTP